MADQIRTAREGLRRKYAVRRLDDPTGKHNDCRFFVLDPLHDPIAAQAIGYYAGLVEVTYPALAADLIAWVRGSATTAETTLECDAVNPKPCACTAAARAARATQAAPGMELRAGERLMRSGESADRMTMWWDEYTWFPFVESESGDITGPGHQDKHAFAAAVLAYYRLTDPDGDDVALMVARVKHCWLLVACNDDGEWRCKVVPEGTADAIPATTVWDL